MIFKRSKLLLTAIIIITFIFIAGFFTSSLVGSKLTEYIFQTNTTSDVKLISPVDTNDLNLPLPKPSIITTEVDKIRLDLEKISINKFFIVYSQIYGDQSHSAYHLYLTNLNKNKLDKEAIGEIYLKTSTGQIIKPVAQVPIVEDFPLDQPLGWKIKAVVKFPYKTKRPVHDLILHYKDKQFNLTGIYY